MDILSQLDPFHLVSLSEDIDNRCQRLVARELPKVVDEKALYNLKVALREETVSLLTEMLNEWRHLSEETGEDSIFDETWIMPGVPEMAVQLPQVYGGAPHGSEEKKAWRVARVRWTINAWLQMWGQMFAYLPAADHTPEFTDSSVNIDVEPSLDHAPKATEILAVMRVWQMLRVLTLEYLGKKSDLLVELGKMEKGINVVDEVPDVIYQAKEAFWSKRANAPSLLVLAIRDTLLSRLDIKEQLRGKPLRLSTPILLVLAADAGVEMPHAVELLGNLCFDLESVQNLGDNLELAYFYSAFRILIQSAEHFESVEIAPSVQARAAMMLSQAIEQTSSYATDSED